jgi:hypothetical protein
MDDREESKKSLLNSPNFRQTGSSGGGKKSKKQTFSENEEAYAYQSESDRARAQMVQE